MLIEALKGIVNVLTDHETVLWENSAPTSAFSAQTITLSDDISNYDEFKIIFKNANTDTSTDTVQFEVQDLIGTGYVGTLGIAGSVAFVRYYQYISGTSLNISTACRLLNNTSNTNYIIPIKIIGIKKEPRNLYELDVIKTIVASFASGTNSATIAIDKKPKSAIWVIRGNFYAFDLENLVGGKSPSYEYYRSSSSIIKVDASSNTYFDNITENSVNFHWGGYSSSNDAVLVLLGNSFEEIDISNLNVIATIS